MNFLKNLVIPIYYLSISRVSSIFRLEIATILSTIVNSPRLSTLKPRSRTNRKLKKDFLGLIPRLISLNSLSIVIIYWIYSTTILLKMITSSIYT
jgi:hypothetical protein